MKPGDIVKWKLDHDPNRKWEIISKTYSTARITDGRNTIVAALTDLER